MSTPAADPGPWAWVKRGNVWPQLAAALMLAALSSGCGARSTGGAQPASTAAVAATSAVPSAPSALTSPTVVLAPAAVRAAAMAVLLASDGHYLALLTGGEQALAAGGGGLYSWRQANHPGRDLSYMQAFKVADAHFTAADEPGSIGPWRDDVGKAQSDLIRWEEDAVSSLVQAVSASTVTQDAQMVRADLSTADAAARAVGAGR